MNISVVIPLYNKRDTILRALNSIMAQTLPPREIIIVNDGSTDGSEIVVEQLNNPLIRLVHQPNAGVSSARNLGIEIARYEWIAFLDADDEWLCNYLSTIKTLSYKYSQCSVLATSYLLKESTGVKNKIILKKISFCGEDGILNNYFNVASHSHPPLWTGAVVVRKLILQKVGGFPEDIHSGEDLVTWARIACKYSIAYSLVPNSVYQINPPTVVDRRKSEHSSDKVAFILSDLKKKCSKNEAQYIRQYIGLYHKMRASIFLNNDEKVKASKEIIKSIFTYPFNLKIYLYLPLILFSERIINRIFYLLRSKLED